MNNKHRPASLRCFSSLAPLSGALALAAAPAAMAQTATEGAPAAQPATPPAESDATAQPLASGADAVDGPGEVVPPLGPSGPREFRFELSLFGGYHDFGNESTLGPVGPDYDHGIAPADGAMFGGRFTLNLNRWIGFEIEGDLSATETRNEATNLGIYGYRGSMIVNLIPSGPVRLFALGGYGAFTSVPKDTEIVSLDTDGSLHVGGGLKIFITDRFGLRLDGRAHLAPSFISDVLPTGDDEDGDTDFTFTGGLFVTLGEIISTERQFYTQRRVVVLKPPPLPEDTDKDGLVPPDDKCPAVAEDADGFQDGDGCPEPDNDGDGLADAEDKCPLAAESRNGIDDEDGCPEEDTDGDGFLGQQDKCPAAPETKNNFQDGDGCPDEIPAAVKKFTGVIEGINFKTGSHEILRGSYAILERAVRVLQEHPDVRLEISGHTDDRGNDGYNQDLSSRRAGAVRQFFIDRGVDAGRLTAVGYGESRPIADNSSASGRASNRRTEFRLLGDERGDEGK